MDLITVVGVGALGSHVVQDIRNLDASIRVIDFDRVEQNNVLSQFHSRSSVGKNKTQAVQQLMQFLFGKKVDVVPHKLVEGNVKELLKDSKLVVDCLDNGSARRLVQGHVRKNNIPCLHGALSADGDFGCAIWDEQFTIDEAPSVGAPTCENGNHLPFIALTSAYIAYAIQQFLSAGNKNSYRVSPGGCFKVSV